MDAQRTKGVRVAKSGVFVGGNKSSFHPRLHFRLTGIAAICAVVLAVAVGATLFTVHIMHNREAAAQRAKLAQAFYNAPLTPNQEADYLAHNGNYDRAQQVLAEQISKTNNTKDQAAIYAHQASIALDAHDYGQANVYAGEAEVTAPSSNTAALVANVAMQGGDRVTAAKYYQLAINRLDKNSPTYGYILRQYQNALKETSQ